MNKLLALALAFAAPALASAASAASVTLTAGQTGTLAGRKITVLRVQDNRCKPGVQCIRAGEIVAKVLVSGGGRMSFLTLQFPEARNAVWSGIKLSGATFDKVRKLTFTDEQ